MLPQLQKIFHSITKSLDVLYVIEGIKPSARILVFEDEINKVMNFLSEKNAYAFFSDFKVVKQNVQSEFYSDKSIKIPKNALQKGHFFVYISKDRKIAEKAKSAEEEGNHKELGFLLGYPQCCCDFFAGNFDGENADLTLKILENSAGYEFPFYTNIAARHFDINLLSHFPHSFGCKPSIEIAKKNLDLIKKFLPPLADLFLKTLSSVTIYTEEEGIFLLKNLLEKDEKANDEIIYSDVLTTAKSKLYYLLTSNKRLRIVDKDSFIIGGIGNDADNRVNIIGAGYGIMIFTIAK